MNKLDESVLVPEVEATIAAFKRDENMDLYELIVGGGKPTVYEPSTYLITRGFSPLQKQRFREVLYETCANIGVISATVVALHAINFLCSEAE